MRRLLSMALACLLGFTVAVVWAFLQATGAADEATAANERQLVSSHVAVAQQSLLERTAIQLTWDDATRAAGGQGNPLDTAWTDTYFGQFLSARTGAEELFLVSPAGDVLRAWHHGQPAAHTAYRPVEGRTRAILAGLPANRSLNGRAARVVSLADTRWPFDAAGRPLSRWASELVSYRGQPAIMTVISLTPDADASLLRRSPNHMVSLRRIDAGVLAGFSKALLLADMRLDTAATPDTGRNRLALHDPEGRMLGWLSWQPNRVTPRIWARTVPLLAAYLCFYVGVIVFGWFVLRCALRMARELSASEAQAQHHALHDPLLGLPNRTHVMQRLTAMIAGTASDAEGRARHVLLAYFDLDHFKSINESVGHHVGDDLLVQAVARLRQKLRPGDVLGRLASDEFVLLRWAVDGRDEADALGNEIMDAFAEPFSVFGHLIPVTASCGIAWAPEHADDPKVLLRNADVALFRAKQRGRARYRRFTRDMAATTRWREDMEVELRRALALDGLSMVYQPIVNVADGSIASFEALLRWHHRDRGEIGPGIFVPVAEQAGLMPQLGDWVLRRVFADSHHFGNAEISVNLSPLQLVARDFMPSLKALIRDEQVDPTRFTFEITEGVLLDKSERVMALLNELQDMGFRVALDDFGTGYSSLAYLRSFQFDRIKIDRSFVQGIESDVDAQSILSAIVALGRTLRMKVVAEGVETMLQQQLVQAAGCQLIQGHLYWRALTPDQVIALLATDRIQNLRIAV